MEKEQNFMYSTLTLSWKKRVLLALTGCLFTFVLLLYWLVVFLMGLIHFLLCGQWRYLHKRYRSMRQKGRWLSICLFAALVSVFSPPTGVLLLVSYARIFGHNIPKSLLRRLLKIDPKFFGLFSQLVPQS